MKVQVRHLPLLIVILSIAALSLQAAPSLLITKPPVQPLNLLTGPNLDPAATNGQWFIDNTTTLEEFCTHEFHDNTIDGAGDESRRAIEGIVIPGSIVYDGFSSIKGFKIKATIRNDSDSAHGTVSASDNSHGETRPSTTAFYRGTLVDTKLVAEFAIAESALVPNLFVPPYRNTTPHIIADNEDQRAWYCWNQGDPPNVPPGNYYVPTWDFGDIPVGQSATRELTFSVFPSMPPTDPRYTVITTSEQQQLDVFANRTSSLKISTWIDDIGIDNDQGGLESMFRNSDVSVFHLAEKVDWGDAPDQPYPTLAAHNGARHTIKKGIFLGETVDAEPDGQPTLQADGDDSNGLDDEDGVIFLTPLIPGTVAQVTIVASGPPALLQGWIDFNGNGSWTDPGDRIFADVLLVSGNNQLTFLVPAKATSGQTYARFRYSSTPGLSFAGPAQDGEVEDYAVMIEPKQDVDWGDTPNPYPTLAFNNGAHHVISPGMFLGESVDAESDGQPTVNADGDDLAGYDDEDGVLLTSLLMPGGYASVQVIASQAGFLDAWVDFENDGRWAESSNRIFTSEPLISGINALYFPIPIAAIQGPAAARFRFTSNGVASYTGLALDGEVEDYLFQIESIQSGIDCGDAPDPTYPTLLANGGASHMIVAGVMLGASIDPEPDGQPSPVADGDDLHGTTPSSDEDGVIFTSALVAGSNATVKVVAGVLGGKLDAWVDFNRNGDWNDAGEKIFSGLTVTPGLNQLNFSVPGLPARGLGPTFARFRISSSGMPLPTGYAFDGEVEDYLVVLYQPTPTNDLSTVSVTFNEGYTVVTNTWTTENGMTFQLESNTNLLTDTWIPVGAVVVDPIDWQTDNISVETTKFYRVVAPWVQ